MSKVVILGTSHSYQRDNTEFACYIEQLVEKYLITCIAEEIDSPGSSTANEIAKKRDLTHIVIEPNLEERSKLGILDIGSEEWKLMNEHGINNWPSGREKDELPQNVYAQYTQIRDRIFRDREKEWWNRIEKTNKWPTLVICGSSHYYPFKDKLIKFGLEVIEANDCWTA